MKDLIIANEIFNRDIENAMKNVKSSEDAVGVVNEMNKIIENNKCSILWLVYKPDQIFQRFKMNNSFRNMVNKLNVKPSWFIKY